MAMSKVQRDALAKLLALPGVVWVVRDQADAMALAVFDTKEDALDHAALALPDLGPMWIERFVLSKRVAVRAMRNK
jgi:hypothetical protein